MKPTLMDVERLARGAGAILRERYNQEHEIRYKGVIDLVTEADHASEAFLIGEIQALFPDSHIVAEESGETKGENEGIWYIDPLDGTVNFAHHIPVFCVSIGYALNGSVILGAVLLTITPEIFRDLAIPAQRALMGRVIIDPENLRMLLFGLALIVVMLVKPAGLWPSPRRQEELKHG